MLRWKILPRDAEHVSALIPGGSDTQVFALHGEMPRGVGARDATVRVWRGDKRWPAADPHACMQVEVNGVRIKHGEAHAQTVPLSFGGAPSAGPAVEDDALRVTLMAQNDCGWTEDDRVRAIPLVFSFENEAADERADENEGVSERPKTQSTTTRISPQYVLKNNSTLPDKTTLAVRAGGAAGTHVWPITRESRAPQRIEVTLERHRSVPPVPECVELRVDAQEQEVATDTPSSTSLIVDVGGAQSHVDVNIHAAAPATCTAGTYNIPLRMKNLSTDRPDVPDAIRALKLTIQPASVWMRWRWVVWLVIAAVGVLFIPALTRRVRRK